MENSFMIIFPFLLSKLKSSKISFLSLVIHFFDSNPMPKKRTPVFKQDIQFSCQVPKFLQQYQHYLGKDSVFEVKPQSDNEEEEFDNQDPDLLEIKKDVFMYFMCNHGFV